VSGRRLRLRFWIEWPLALIGLVLAVLTMLIPDWFERLFEASPDNGSGEFEWLISLGFLLLAVVMGVLARREWHRSVVIA
jgi:hypothetical protein